MVEEILAMFVYIPRTPRAQYYVPKQLKGHVFLEAMDTHTQVLYEQDQKSPFQ
jgi:hypothetical protein